MICIEFKSLNDNFNSEKEYHHFVLPKLLFSLRPSAWCKIKLDISYTVRYIWGMVRSEKTRQIIIEKTASIFNKKGYTGTYLSDLVRATGLTKGSIYGNFKDKNEVAVEAFRFNYKFQTEQVMALIQREQRADRKLLAFLDHYKTRYSEIFKNGGCAILNTAVDADDGNDALKKEVTEKINNWIARISAILKDGIKNSEIRHVDTKAFACKMVAMVEGSVLLSKTLNQPEILLSNIEFLEKEITALRK
ncbi:MAG: TetR/AcrR family transcriptional regulator [Cytophagales bacterium]|nr:TetR/AcrR family transcriptional regulator [Cytophagales bacterium]